VHVIGTRHDAVCISGRLSGVGLLVVELALGALRAEDDELIVRIEVGTPAISVKWQPYALALLSLRDQRDWLSAHDWIAIAT
jgi:hypothetical protein